MVWPGRAPKWTTFRTTASAPCAIATATTAGELFNSLATPTPSRRFQHPHSRSCVLGSVEFRLAVKCEEEASIPVTSNDLFAQDVEQGTLAHLFP